MERICAALAGAGVRLRYVLSWGLAVTLGRAGLAEKRQPIAEAKIAVEIYETCGRLFVRT